MDLDDLANIWGQARRVNFSLPLLRAFSVDWRPRADPFGRGDRWASLHTRQGEVMASRDLD